MSVIARDGRILTRAARGVTQDAAADMKQFRALLFHSDTQLAYL